MTGDERDNQEHFIGFTIAELTVIATALLKHQQQTDNFVGYRGATRFHTAAVAKIQTYCDGLKDGEPPIATDARAFARWVQSRTKHGPGGSGFPGACDADCVKCHAEAFEKTQPASPLEELLKLWAVVEKTSFINADGSTADWSRAYMNFEREIRRLLAGATS